MNVSNIAKRLDISGVVQGVGFRPFLFILAKKYHLTGWVSNTSSGVEVFIQGKPKNIKLFCNDIVNKSPLLASVTGIESKDAVTKAYASFQIEKSVASNSRSTLISPDVTICKDCLSEMFDPTDRRYGYPFINCTNCGPRYTIIEDIPYDRPKTSMKLFTMCAACQKEYEDPLNRRFHAQPNACPDCGPRVFLTDNNGNDIESNPDTAIETAAKYLKQGKIIAVKGLGGFHLACDASNADAVVSLRQKKNRPHKPFALMTRSSSDLFDHVHMNDMEKELLHSYHRPIVLFKKKNNANQFAGMAQDVSPLNNCIGIMLPYTPLHYLLLEKGPQILVMTSGNRSGEPLSIDNKDAIDAFSHIADCFLLHNRDIYFRADDSIARIQKGESRFIRRSRGYAPLPVFYKKKLPSILACGAGLKNTICLTRGNYLFLSQHVGDLENIKTHDFYLNSIDHLKRILDIKPELIVHDLHPGYMSTQYAKAFDCVETIKIQHHHAHAVACMAENDIDEPVIAVTLDGTGLGTDGHVWGGEILLTSLASFQRKAHLSYIGMPGGDKAVLEPWRMAASILFDSFGDDFLNLDIEFLKQIETDKLTFIIQIIKKDLNTPKTSSAGRLFDAVSSLLCIRHTISLASQSAMELEAIAQTRIAGKTYDFDLLQDQGEAGFQISMSPCIRQIVEDIKIGLSSSIISAGFHQTLVNAFVKATIRVSCETKIKKVVLSGGVFNNDTIFCTMISALEQNGLTVYTHSKVPTGDGGISFGQAIFGAAMKGKL
ncbi:MAG: carbamoyltransferase HypF [Desulfobacula sp.]|nr:carbamoyltransferase HypF [Desulfobacula sp.]